MVDEERKHGKLLSDTSIDALLCPSRLTPPGPYDPEQSPLWMASSKGLPVCRNENGRTNGLDSGCAQHAVVTAYGNLPYSDSQGKRSPDAEPARQPSSRKCRFVTTERIITFQGRFTL
jgi:hypothetical protein